MFATTADTKEGLVLHVRATDVVSARVQAYKQADEVIHVAGVVAGTIQEAPEGAPNVLPIRGAGLTLAGSVIRVTSRHVTIPSRCRHCRADLRDPRGLEQVDLSARAWDGHLARDGGSILPERDPRPRENGDHLIRLVRATCAGCRRHAWDGLEGLS